MNLESYKAHVTMHKAKKAISFVASAGAAVRKLNPHIYGVTETGQPAAIVNDLEPKPKAKRGKRKAPSYNISVLNAFFHLNEIPIPHYELAFHPDRKWRFDMAWGREKVALEVQGGIWGNGRHNRGAAMLQEWEKLNTAAGDGWRILYCQPNDLMTGKTADFIKNALKH